jgi:hypothetical protein
MVKTPFKETEYKGWCSANGVTPGDNRYMEFLRQRNYETWDIDPPEYPGINAACGWIRGQGLKYGRHYEALSEHHREWIREMMNKKYANDCMTGQFEIGKTVGDRFTIKSTLTGAGAALTAVSSL